MKRTRAPVSRAAAAAALAGLLLSAATACGNDSTGPDGPQGHTVFRDGVPHAPGLQAPATNCASCHGGDLRGGPDGEPSCFSCHGRVWP